MGSGAAAQSLGNLEWGPKLCKSPAGLAWHPGNETAAKDSLSSGAIILQYSKVRVRIISAKSKWHKR